jgi:hypothetical protein
MHEFLKFILEMKLYTFPAVQDGTAVSSWSCCSKAVYKTVWHIPLLSAQWIGPDDGQRNCRKHVEFHFQNKVEKLLHLVGFIIRKWEKSICLDVDFEIV